MASLAGHALGAFAAYQSVRTLAGSQSPSGAVVKHSAADQWFLVLPVLIGILPDLDILVYLLWHVQAGGMHRGISHSLLFGLAYAALFTLLSLAWRKVSWPVLFLALAAAAMMHPLLDYLMARGPKLPLLWPFSPHRFLSPIQLIPTAYYSSSVRGFFQASFYIKSLKGVALELLQLGPLCLCFFVRSRLLRGGLIALALSGWLLVYLIYA